MSTDVNDLLEQARTALTAAQRQIARDIADYPTPIAGCDAQFNHLLAERTRIGQALLALRQEVFVPTPRVPMPSSEGAIQ